VRWWTTRQQWVTRTGSGKSAPTASEAPRFHGNGAARRWVGKFVPGHPDDQPLIDGMIIINARIAIASGLTPFQPRFLLASRRHRA
jgi:hypothetical protein